jgi:hypothetical protein
MSRTLKPGDRVRVTHSNRVPGYPPGEKGTVIQGLEPPCDDDPYLPCYVVHMDKDGPTKNVIFRADEIELDP